MLPLPLLLPPPPLNIDEPMNGKANVELEPPTVNVNANGPMKRFTSEGSPEKKEVKKATRSGARKKQAASHKTVYGRASVDLCHQANQFSTMLLKMIVWV